MKNYYYLFLFILIAQKGISQSWVPLGTNGQTQAVIAHTITNNIFTQVTANGTPYISYVDAEEEPGPGDINDGKAHAKRYVNGAWEFAGDSISPPFPNSDYIPLATDGNVVYAAYTEPAFVVANIGTRLTVKRLDANTGKWETVGQRGFSETFADGTAITASNGKIYVAYMSNVADLIVRYYDTTRPADGWQTLLTEAPAGEILKDINIAIDSGIPYIAYTDYIEQKLVVKKYNGATWENVGTNDAAGGARIASCSLKFNSQHIPYLALIDTNYNAAVRSLNNLNAWVPVGNSPSVAPVTTSISLVILKDIPFVAFGVQADATTSQLLVKKLNTGNSTWVATGDQPVATGVLSYRANTFALNTDDIGKLFMVYLNDVNIYAKSFDASAILPVSLTDFTATRVKDANLLQWTTASELNNKLFEIEHSSDAKTFTKIGEVAANGNTNVKQQYSFIHSSPVAGINYYRLKQVDKNGNYSYSKTISIIFNQLQPVLTIFPNPAQNVLHISSIPAGVKEIVIYSADGKAVKNIQNKNSSIDINVAALSAGSYFIRFYGDDINETKKFIK